jgi:hypothetical protein
MATREPENGTGSIMVIDAKGARKVAMGVAWKAVTGP